MGWNGRDRGVLTRTTRIPARCNKRSCQARRNLSKRPEYYVRWPKCNYKNCNGKMYVDEYRLRKGPKDNPPVCHDDCYPYPHKVDSKNCKQREAFCLARAERPPSKHRPFPPEEPPF